MEKKTIANSSEKREDEKVFNFFDHLDELAARSWRCLLAIIAASILFSFFVEDFMYMLIKPIDQVVFTAPGDAFLAQFYLIIVGGIILSLPYLIYEAWQFVASAVKENERKFVSVFMPVSVGLFVVGAVFAFTVAVPIAMQFLLSFRNDYILPMITIKSYVSFIGTMILAFGAIFELPLILTFLAKIGIATPEFLIQKRKFAVVGILLLSALITPPDVITQLIMSVPLIVLYEIGIIAAKITVKKEKAKLN